METGMVFQGFPPTTYGVFFYTVHLPDRVRAGQVERPTQWTIPCSHRRSDEVSGGQIVLGFWGVHWSESSPFWDGKPMSPKGCYTHHLASNQPAHDCHGSKPCFTSTIPYTLLLMSSWPLTWSMLITPHSCNCLHHWRLFIHSLIPIRQSPSDGERELRGDHQPCNQIDCQLLPIKNDCQLTDNQLTQANA